MRCKRIAPGGVVDKAGIRKRIQERQQIGALGFAQHKALHENTLIGVPPAVPSMAARRYVAAAGRIKVEHSRQRCQTAVVHVGGCIGDVAQGGGPKLATIPWPACELKQTLVRVVAPFGKVVQARIVKRALQQLTALMGTGLGEIKSAVAMMAFQALGEKQVQAAPGRCGQRRVIIAIRVAVKGRISGDQAADEAGKRLHRVFVGQHRRVGKRGCQ